MNKIKLSEVIQNKKMVIHTPLEDQAKALCKRLDELGLKWIDGESYLKITSFKTYNNKTCYSPREGQFGTTDFHLEHHYQVIEFADIDLEK